MAETSADSHRSDWKHLKIQLLSKSDDVYKKTRFSLKLETRKKWSVFERRDIMFHTAVKLYCQWHRATTKWNKYQKDSHTYPYMTPCWSSFLDLVYWLFIFKLFAGFIYRHSEEWQDSRVREGKGGQGLQLAALHHHTAARSSLWADSCINVHFVPQSVRFYSSVTSFWFHSIRPSLCTLLRALLFFIPSL